jgi:thioredoxin reductase
MSRDVYDAIIVGGSFAGLAAALQLARARRRVLVVDAGRPRNRFARTSHGFLGQDGRSPTVILETARAQLRTYGTAEYRPGEVTGARLRDDAFEIALGSDEARFARRLVIATGVIDVLPDVPGLRERWGVTVLHCPYCHGFEVAGRRLGILATSELSMHQALLIPDWSDDVTLFTNGAMSLDADQRAVLASRGVRVDERPVAELLGDVQDLSGVRLQDGTVIALDALFTGPRTRMASPLAEQLGCAFDDTPMGPMIRTDERKLTTVPGVYAAGDAARYPHNVSWAVGDGVMAGIAAHQSLALPGPPATPEPRPDQPAAASQPVGHEAG